MKNPTALKSKIKPKEKKKSASSPDSTLTKLFALISDAPYRCLVSGEKLLPTTTDKIAVLQAMQEAVRTILSDLDEHGDANIDEYGGKGKAFYLQKKKFLSEQLDNVKKAGASSSAFNDYMKAEREKIKKAAAEFVSDMDGDEALSTEILKGIQKNAKSPTAALSFLSRVGEIKMPDSEFKNTLSGLVNNVIQAATVNGKHGAACQIVQAYAKFISRIGVDAEFHEELLTNAIHAAVANGDKKTQLVILEKLAPRKFNSPGCAFNFACLYAVNKNKPKMIQAISAARQLGKPVSQFMDDSDFSAYWKDADFLAALRSKK